MSHVSVVSWFLLFVGVVVVCSRFSFQVDNGGMSFLFDDVRESVVLFVGSKCFSKFILFRCPRGFFVLILEFMSVLSRFVDKRGSMDHERVLRSDYPVLCSFSLGSVIFMDIFQGRSLSC